MACFISKTEIRWPFSVRTKFWCEGSLFVVYVSVSSVENVLFTVGWRKTVVFSLHLGASCSAL